MSLLATFLLGVTAPGGVNPTPAATPAPTFGANVIGFSFLLSTMVWVPVLVAIVLATIPNPRHRYDRGIMLTAFWANLGLLVLALIGYTQFQTYSTGLQYEENLAWLPTIGARYHLGVDGISMTVLLLSSLIGVIGVIASSRVRERVRAYFVLLLLLQSAVNGVIAAQDFFVLLLFWAAAILPVALLVVGWNSEGDALGESGAAPTAAAAAASAGLARFGIGGLARAGRLLGYWTLGTAALAAAGLVLYRASGATTFDFAYLLKADPGPRGQVVVGVALAVAAATRLPLFPLHGWIREALAEAAPGVAVVVAGSAARLGGYLLVRLLVGAEHDAARLLAPFLAAFAAATVVYAGLAAWRAPDLRRMAAYLALVPGGITVLGLTGLTPLSIDGAVLSIFAGGAAAALLVGAAASIGQRAQATSLSVLGGLAPRMPRLTWLWLIGGLAVLGAPLLASYPADLMIFSGSFKHQPAAAFIVLGGLVLVAGALAWVMYRVLFGAANPDAPPAADASLSETWYLGLLAAALLWVGILPSGPKLGGVPFFDPGLLNVINAAASDLASPYAASTDLP